MGSMASSATVFRLIVGTFNTPELFLLSFHPESNTLQVDAICSAVGNHSWLGLDASHTILLATCWTEPPGIAAYRLADGGTNVKLLGTQQVQSRSGYVTANRRAGRSSRAYTAGGPSGEVLQLDGKTGRLMATLQQMDYITGAVRTTEKGNALLAASASQTAQSAIAMSAVNDDGRADADNVMDFGGLRHGAHSADLSPDGRLLYVADIGRNCVWVHDVDEQGLLGPAEKVVSPRSNDGPRHVWPHPAGRYVYVLQEHSCMVDVFRVRSPTEQSDARLVWIQGVRIIPGDQDEKLYWADEVRTVASSVGQHNHQPDLLVASTRGLQSGTKGYVALFAMTAEGLVDTSHASGRPNGNVNHAGHPHGWLDLWQTPTSGGWANAIEPCARPLHPPRTSLLDKARRNEGQYMALTDSEQGLVMVLAVERDSKGAAQLVEVARLSLGKTSAGKVRGAATAVWL